MRPRILYVEDDEDANKSFSCVLTESFPEQEVDSATTFDDGLKKFDPENTFLVYVDGGLDGKHTGPELARELRSRGYTGPIVYVGFSDVRPEDRGLFSDIIYKISKMSVERSIEAGRRHLGISD